MVKNTQNGLVANGNPTKRNNNTEKTQILENKPAVPAKKRKLSSSSEASQDLEQKVGKKQKKGPSLVKEPAEDDAVKKNAKAEKLVSKKNQHRNEIQKGEKEEGSEEVFRNKEKVLVVSSRGITFRYRHLMEDLMLLLPHSKKDAKLENSKENRASMLNEMADLKGCSSCVFFEGRKRKDLYMWISKTPNGPSAKFLVNAVHTMAELKLSGNHLKGSRPIVTFSPSFDKVPHLQLLKEMFSQILVTPKDHRKVKPFFDHVLSLTVADNHIWFRNYQITVQNPSATKVDPKLLEKMTLVEVGPRFCLNPIKIFSGSFGGVTLYENPLYVSPNAVRSEEKRAKAGKYVTKVKAKQKRRQHLAVNPAQADEFADIWRES